jgi:hypothetical protein
MGNIGSIPGSYIIQSQYGPLCITSFGAELAILGMGCVCAVTLRTYLRYLNRKMDVDEESIEGDGEREEERGREAISVLVLSQIPQHYTRKYSAVSRCADS